MEDSNFFESNTNGALYFCILSNFAGEAIDKKKAALEALDFLDDYNRVFTQCRTAKIQAKFQKYEVGLGKNCSIWTSFLFNL
jgi:hypothetical protein